MRLKEYICVKCLELYPAKNKHGKCLLLTLMCRAQMGEVTYPGSCGWEVAPGWTWKTFWYSLESWFSRV